MITLFHGNNFQARYSILVDSILEETELFNQKTIIILPSNRWEKSFKSEMLHISKSSALIDAQVFSYSTFIGQTYSKLSLFDSELARKREISSFFKLLIVRKILNELVLQLSFYTFEETPPEGIIKSILSVIEELIKNGFDSDFHTGPITGFYRVLTDIELCAFNFTL
ncbi:MAG: hypothetical protein HRU08_12275 [Oleispira sp.]|nr:hypothetical protein [Oleispira sp.]